MRRLNVDVDAGASMDGHCDPAPAAALTECARPGGLGLYCFDARGIAKRFRHAAIFGALSALTPGETMRFYNDHDPAPLLAQLTRLFGARLKIRYISRNHGEVIIDLTVLG